jgi:hypothetical protein
MDELEKKWLEICPFNVRNQVQRIRLLNDYLGTNEQHNWRKEMLEQEFTPSDGLLWTMVQQRKEFNKTNKTMKEKIYVKSESVQTFLSEKMINHPGDNGRVATNGVSYYHLMRDSILIRKDSGVEIGDTIRVELDDQAQGSCRQLTNTYIYEAKSFDDVAIKLVLIDFKIELK